MSELLYGLHAIESLLQTQPERVLRLYVLAGRADKKIQQLLQIAEQFGVPVQSRERRALDDMANGGVHQGLIAECKVQSAKTENDLLALLDALDVAPFLLLLDGITDPHNVGAILRSADAAGVHAVIAPKDRSATLNATVRKVACGAAERVPFVSVTNLARTMRELRERGIWIVGTAGEASNSVFDSTLTGPLAVVMGAEGEGMRRLTREHCDALIHIPMLGSVSSLNVSVATGICLFEAVRQRSVASK